MENVFIAERLKNLDLSFQHASYRLEKKVCEEIKLGQYNEAMETLKTINSQPRAKLSSNEIRSTKNSLIASCTLFTRAVIEGGVGPEVAFALSDALILILEAMDTLDELSVFEYQMVDQFISLVNSSNNQDYSHHIMRAVNHIQVNISKNLKASEIAKAIALSPDYLSRLFKKEMNITVTDYIHKEKIEIAKKFIKFSDKSLTDIAYILNYSSPGHFTKIFKKHSGITPKEYKKSI